MTLLPLQVTLTANEDSEIIRLIDARTAKAVAKSLPRPDDLRKELSQQLSDEFAQQFGELKPQLSELRQSARWSREQLEALDSKFQTVANAKAAQDQNERQVERAIERAVERSTTGSASQEDLNRFAQRFRKQLEDVEGSLGESSSELQRLGKDAQQLAAETTAAQERSDRAAQGKVSSEQLEQAISALRSSCTGSVAALDQQVDEMEQQHKRTGLALSELEHALKAKVSIEHFDEVVECLHTALGRKDRAIELQSTLLQERLQELESAVPEKASRREVFDLLEQQQQKTERSTNALLSEVDSFIVRSVERDRERANSPPTGLRSPPPPPLTRGGRAYGDREDYRPGSPLPTATRTTYEGGSASANYESPPYDRESHGRAGEAAWLSRRR
jgi:hypothetical protein